MRRTGAHRKLDLHRAVRQLDPDPEPVWAALGDHAEPLPVTHLPVDGHGWQVLRRLIDDSGFAQLGTHDGVPDPPPACSVEHCDHQVVDLAAAVTRAAVQIGECMFVFDDGSRHEPPVQRHPITFYPSLGKRLPWRQPQQDQ